MHYLELQFGADSIIIIIIFIIIIICSHTGNSGKKSKTSHSRTQCELDYKV